MEEKQSPSGESIKTSALSSPLEQLLGDPNLSEKLRSILSQGNTESSTNPDDAAEKAEVLPPLKGIGGDGLASVLQNPELMAKLPQVMALLKPMMSGIQPPSVPQKTPQVPSPEAERNNLLLSLKPFLSPGRRDAVDAMLRISNLGKILKEIH